MNSSFRVIRSTISTKIPAVSVAFLILVLPLILQTPVSAQTVTAFGLDLSTLESDIENEIAEGRIPSAQAGIIINDDLVWAKGFGDQPSLDTVFRIASITKTFTATAFLQLHERGLVDLDADVSDYLPFEVRNPNDPSVVITARMLLSHRAGMVRDYYFGVTPFGNSIVEFLNDLVGEMYTPWTGPYPPLGEIINSTNIADPDLWLTNSGISYLYSNSGFFFLSFLLEKITNQTFSDYIDENILTPLRMSSTGLNGSEFSNRLAIPHGTWNSSLIVFPHYEHYRYGAGALLSTVLDLSNYLIAHMNEGTSNGVQILEPESAETMHSVISNGYGLGWQGDTFQGHLGRHYGFESEMWYNEVEDNRYGIILLINRDYGPDGDPDELHKSHILSILHQQGRDMLEWTNLTTTNQTLDLVILGGVSASAAIIIVGAVFILKRRSG
ncbi:MAG: serine hydrolase domain-containing protein [Candidatus Thorarchaeota archaeon]|jgi:CubicO group peptidase (beta-lactamase class C family)